MLSIASAAPYAPLHAPLNVLATREQSVSILLPASNSRRIFHRFLSLRPSVLLSSRAGGCGDSGGRAVEFAAIGKCHRISPQKFRSNALHSAKS